VYPYLDDIGPFVPVGTNVTVRFGIFRIDRDLEADGQKFLEQLGLTDIDHVCDVEGNLPLEQIRFVETVDWVFAVTYAKTWPHHYIVKDRVDETLFLKLVRHIRRYGYEGRFYKLPSLTSTTVGTSTGRWCHPKAIRGGTLRRKRRLSTGVRRTQRMRPASGQELCPRRTGVGAGEHV
jgi:hypothetical protein